jgi:phage baseplate assembly protein W
MSVTPKAISLPFSFDVNGAVTTTTDDKKVVQDRVVVALMTLLGERVMRPTYGTNARSLAFENISSVPTAMEQYVQIGFSEWLPYLNLLSVDTGVDLDSNSIVLTVTYNYGPSTTPVTVSVRTAILDRTGNIITEVPSVY